MALHHILVRDFTTDQKKAVDAAADAAKTSTSKFCRDAAVLRAGGKLEDDAPSIPAKAVPVIKAATARLNDAIRKHVAKKKPAAKRPSKKVAPAKPKAPAKRPSIFDAALSRVSTKKPANLMEPQFRNKAKGKL